MCFILTAVKLKENDEALHSILNVLQNEQQDNSHGVGSVCYSKKDKPVIQRDMVRSIVEMKSDLLEFDVVNYHFRQSTIGKKTVDNVHFWQKGNWAFCHNGHIDAMGNVEESDSLVFFKHLIKQNFLTKDNKLKGQKIKDYTNEQSFWGRFLIINVKTKNIYFFGDFELALVNKSYLVFTSSPTTFENKFEVMNLKFDLPENIETLDTKIDGVVMFDYNKQQFIPIFETFKEWNYGSRQRNNPSSVGFHGNNSQPTVPLKQTYLPEPKKGKAKEEDENLSNDELLVNFDKQKNRDNESYIKEFYSRLSAETRTQPYLLLTLEEEFYMNMINERGLSLTEQDYWDLWIVPQLEALGKKDDIVFESRLEMLMSQ